MELIPAAKNNPNQKKNESGIALFMVIAAVSILSILVTEFTYIAQVNQKMAFDGLDQLKAHYLAKSGLKISLLRLKAYQNINQYIQTMVKGAGGDAKTASALVPKALVDKIWSFPYFYPFPTNVPGMTPSDKEKIQIFEKASGLEGKFSANIESESNKYNLNSILAGYVPTASPSPAPSPTPPPGGGPPAPVPTPTPQEFKPEDARNGLRDFLGQLLQTKMDENPEFADQYRDPHLMEDLMDNIVAWADISYERKSQRGEMPMKRAPFYSLTELHMIPGLDDDLYNLFAPNLTVTRTPGVNVNTMTLATLKALFPLALKDELDLFFKDRDSEETDGVFKTEDDFFKYIKAHFSVYARADTLDKRKKDFEKGHVQFVTDETEFKITVQAQVNQSTRLIEAWVTLGAPNPEKPNPSPSGQPPGAAPTPPSVNPVTTNGASAAPDPGLKIHFMRIL